MEIAHGLGLPWRKYMETHSFVDYMYNINSKMYRKQVLSDL